jgi:hypothetical protein
MYKGVNKNIERINRYKQGINWATNNKRKISTERKELDIVVDDIDKWKKEHENDVWEIIGK